MADITPKIPPHRICGSTYFVGEYRASSHLIDTGSGLILIDTGYEETADIIMEGMKTLGFDIKDVKIILHSHGHGDHTYGTRRLLEHCAAETYIGEEDIPLLGKRGLEYYEHLAFVPDKLLEDGGVVNLGSTEILCLHTPGHTLGTYSFFWDTVEDGKVYRVGTFGGAGVNQMKRRYLWDRDLPFFQRGMYYKSLDRLRDIPVDVFVGNHAWNNDAYGRYTRSLEGGKSCFIDSEAFGKFINRLYGEADKMIRSDGADNFVNFAHRGASEYAPENTLMSFYLGMVMGANGIETDVQKTRDGVLVLFHDDTLERVVGVSGAIEDYTYDELCKMSVKKGELFDKIVTFEDFLSRFSHFDIFFAIELKRSGLEKEVSELIYKYGIEKRTVVTSFRYDALLSMKAHSPNLKLGYLTLDFSDEVAKRLMADGIDEICPKAGDISGERVWELQKMGFNVRAWGVFDEEIMRRAYENGVNGMTVNFPDKLTALLKENK